MSTAAPQPGPARKRIPLEMRLRSERLRLGLAMAAAIPVTLAVVWVPLLLDADLAQGVGTAALLTIIGIVAGGSSYAAAYAGLTHWTFLRLSRREVVISARHSRAAPRGFAARWLMGRGSATSEIFSLLLIAVCGVLVLLTVDDERLRPLLLLWAIAAILATWYSSVITFAMEYAAADAHSDAFEMVGADRDFEDYVYLSLLLQVSAAPSDIVPRVRRARRAVRTQAVLAHIMNTAVISLGVSVVLSAL